MFRQEGISVSFAQICSRSDRTDDNRDPDHVHVESSGKKPFTFLKSQEKRTALMDGLTKAIAACPFTLRQRSDPMSKTHDHYSPESILIFTLRILHRAHSFLTIEANAIQNHLSREKHQAARTRPELVSFDRVRSSYDDPESVRCALRWSIEKDNLHPADARIVGAPMDRAQHKTTRMSTSFK